MSAHELYARAAALGLDFDPGFDDGLLAERVEAGLCEDGIVVFAVGAVASPCAGCAACLTADHDWRGAYCSVCGADEAGSFADAACPGFVESGDMTDRASRTTTGCSS